MLSERLVGHGILKEKGFAQKLQNIAKRFAVVMDEKVASLFRGALERHALDLHFFTFPPGEAFKTRSTKERLEDEMFSAGFGRGSALIAMGGGVTTDLGGFLAATFCRGVPLVLIPTTLMAMCDASIGGKTAVNTPFGKNLIGAFYPARLTIVDLETLVTLPERERKAGMAEVIKYGLTLDPELLVTDCLETLIQRSIDLKESVTQRDFWETGERRILNFGHTVAHAIERLENYQLLHGEALFIGMAIESMMSRKLGYLSESNLQKILTTLHPYLRPCKESASDLFTAMAHDKKGVRFVLLEEIGKVHPCGGSYCMDVNPEILKEALDQYAALTYSLQPA